ncbi:MAG: hypothetical protein HY910_07485 [Desulfarculus sp.]|nr:hypothetical protein [Desulfarculus sp.]
MLQKSFGIALATLVAAGALLSAGCATTGADLRASGQATVNEAGQPTPFTDTKVIQADEGLVITGAVKRKVLGNATANPGHIDVVVYDAKRAVLAKASKMVRFSVFTAKNQVRTMAPLASFRFEFPVRAAEGAHVRLSFHKESPFTWSNDFDCGDNVIQGTGRRDISLEQGRSKELAGREAALKEREGDPL